MGRYHELAPGLHMLVHQDEELEQAPHRERRLGLVEAVPAAGSEAVVYEGEERLSVRQLMEADVSVRVRGSVVVDGRGDVEERLGTEEVPRARARTASDAQVFVEIGNGAVDRAEIHLIAAPLRVEPLVCRDRLDQRRLSAAVAAHEERHGRSKVEFAQSFQGRKIEGMSMAIRHVGPVDLGAQDERSAGRLAGHRAYPSSWPRP